MKGWEKTIKCCIGNQCQKVKDEQDTFLQILTISKELEISSNALNDILKTSLKKFQSRAINVVAKVKMWRGDSLISVIKLQLYIKKAWKGVILLHVFEKQNTEKSYLIRKDCSHFILFCLKRQQQLQ